MNPTELIPQYKRAVTALNSNSNLLDPRLKPFWGRLYRAVTSAGVYDSNEDYVKTVEIRTALPPALYKHMKQQTLNEFHDKIENVAGSILPSKEQRFCLNTYAVVLFLYLKIFSTMGQRVSGGVVNNQSLGISRTAATSVGEFMETCMKFDETYPPLIDVQLSDQDYNYLTNVYVQMFRL